jgi:type IV pilus assembly protein PilV
MASIYKTLQPVDYRSRGFTFMEVLISVFIMAVGILGLVGLQITSLNMNRDALMSIEAHQMMADLVDRIDSNSATSYGPVDFGDAPVDGPDCTLANCTPAQMANYDVSQWLCAINSEDVDGVTHSACTGLAIDGIFPQGQGAISLADDQYRIRLQWVDVHTDEARSSELYLQVN